VIKDIVVNLVGQGPQDFAADYAVSVAATFRAHITGIAFIYDPVIPDGALGAIPVELIESQREENSRTARSAAARLETAAKAAGISFETRTMEASLGGSASAFASIARRFDLAVLGQAQRERGASEDVMIEAALFESGRPLIVVPYIQKEGFKLDRVIVCWDGSRTAARAVADAMPLLERAKAADVVMVEEERKRSESADLVEHLGRHGISARAKPTSRGDISIDNVILSYAADTAADLLVMGGYGHSRLREFVLGGVTRGILASMTVPVLMSH
jgi:nucleotide-binding universal stress UspA family protein